MKKTAYELMEVKYKELLWGVRLVYPEVAWMEENIEENLNKIKIAIIDSGVESNHDDLKGSILKGYNFVDNNQNTEDLFGHGTRIAGIISARRINGKGVAGVASGVKIIPLKVIGNNNKAHMENVLKAYKWCIKNDVDVINISMGHYQDKYDLDNMKYYREEERLIALALEKGISIIAPVGNNNLNVVQYPAAYPGVISVASYGVTKNPFSLYFSPKNNKILNDTIFAPGEYIYTTDIKNSYVYDFGSSMACGFVSAAVAYMKAMKPDLNPSEIYKLLLINMNIISGKKVNVLNIEKSFLELKNLIRKEEM